MRGVGGSGWQGVLGQEGTACPEAQRKQSYHIQEPGWLLNEGPGFSTELSSSWNAFLPGPCSQGERLTSLPPPSSRILEVSSRVNTPLLKERVWSTNIAFLPT